MDQMPPESSAERYRRRAEELRERATVALNPETQRELLVIAMQYDKLADDVTPKS